VSVVGRVARRVRARRAGRRVDWTRVFARLAEPDPDTDAAWVDVTRALARVSRPRPSAAFVAAEFAELCAQLGGVADRGRQLAAADLYLTPSREE
jgi:hypothetical protein